MPSKSPVIDDETIRICFLKVFLTPSITDEMDNVPTKNLIKLSEMKTIKV